MAQQLDLDQAPTAATPYASDVSLRVPRTEQGVDFRVVGGDGEIRREQGFAGKDLAGTIGAA